MRVDSGLLVELADALDVADVAGVLAQEETGVVALDLAVGFFLLLGLLQRDDPRLGQDAFVLG